MIGCPTFPYPLTGKEIRALRPAAAGEPAKSKFGQFPNPADHFEEPGPSHRPTAFGVEDEAVGAKLSISHRVHDVAVAQEVLQCVKIGIRQDSQPRWRDSNLCIWESDPLHSLSRKARI
jgi:hypothetical protein